MPIRKKGRSWLIYVLAAIIFVAGAVFWTSGLELDPAMRIAHLGQSVATDPAYCVYHARNYVKFGDSNPFDYTEWLVFQRSLISLTAYAWFSVAGVSYRQANVVGVLLSLGALVLFLLAIARQHRPWMVALFALCFLASPSLTIHGRLPYLENGLMFFVALLFFIQSRWSDTSWGPYLAGALVAAGMFMGKLFGVLVLPALLLAQWFSGEDRHRKTLASLGAFIAAAVILVVVLYSEDLSAAYRHYVAGTYSLHGYPDGLTSPWAAFEHLLSYGTENKILSLDLPLRIFLWLSGILLTYLMVGGVRPDRFSPVTRLALFAVPSILLGVMPLNYSPLRYGIILIPLSAILSFGLSDYIISGKQLTPKKGSYARFIVFFLVVWHILFQLTEIVLATGREDIRTVTWSTLPAAVAVTLLFRYYLNRGKLILRRGVLYAVLAVVIVLALVNTYNIKVHLLSDTNISIKEASEDLSQILGPDAVVAGPYASVFTLDNNIKSFIHFFAVVDVDTSLFERYPITHLAIDSSSWVEAVQNYPALENMRPVATYLVRNFAVRICPIMDLVGNAQAKRYQETGYEKAARYIFENKVDSALPELQAFLVDHPNCRSANLALADQLMITNRFQQAITVLNGLAARHPTDYFTNLNCGRYFQIMGLVYNDYSLLSRSRECYQRALRSNAFRAEQVQKISEQTNRQYGRSARPGQSSP